VKALTATLCDPLQPICAPPGPAEFAAAMQYVVGAAHAGAKSTISRGHAVLSTCCLLFMRRADAELFSSLRSIHPASLDGAFSICCASATNAGVEGNTYVPMPPTTSVVLALAMKSPPEVAHGCAAPKKRSSHVASPGSAGVPVPSAPGASDAPSPQLASMRWTVIVSLAEPAIATCTCSATDVIVAPAGTFAATSK
jgi:hypothetical protein